MALTALQRQALARLKASLEWQRRTLYIFLNSSLGCLLAFPCALPPVRALKTAQTDAGKGLMTWLIDFDGYTLKNAPSLKVCVSAVPAQRTTVLFQWLSPAWEPGMLVPAVCGRAVLAGLSLFALALACLGVVHAHPSSLLESYVCQTVPFFHWLLPARDPRILILARRASVCRVAPGF